MSCDLYSKQVNRTNNILMKLIVRGLSNNLNAYEQEIYKQIYWPDQQHCYTTNTSKPYNDYV